MVSVGEVTRLPPVAAVPAPGAVVDIGVVVPGEIGVPVQPAKAIMAQKMMRIELMVVHFIPDNTSKCYIIFLIIPPVQSWSIWLEEKSYKKISENRA